MEFSFGSQRLPTQDEESYRPNRLLKSFFPLSSSTRFELHDIQLNINLAYTFKSKALVKLLLTNTV